MLLFTLANHSPKQMLHIFLRSVNIHKVSDPHVTSLCVRHIVITDFRALKAWRRGVLQYTIS